MFHITTVFVSLFSFSPLLEAWRRPGYRVQCLVTLVILVPVLVVFARFLDTIEQRVGVALPDPVLALFPAINLTWVTFLVIYAGLIFAIIILLQYPQHLLLAMQTYAMMAILRMAAMYLTPLDAPPGMIALRDPFVEFFGGGRTLTRDLFFSGHTATLFILCLSMPERRAKMIYVVCTAAVAVCVVLQHVHYTIDVFAALFFAFGAYHLVCAIRKLFLDGPGEGYIQ